MHVSPVNKCVVCGTTVERTLDGEGAIFFCPACFHLEKGFTEVISYSGYILPMLDEEALREQVKFLARGLPIQAKIFELGVAQGILARAMRNSHDVARYDGIELSERAAGAAQVTDTLFKVSLEAIPALERLRHAPYDLVVMSHVLEHIRDLNGMVAMLGGLTGATGRLFIEVPNRAGHPAVDLDHNRLHYHSFSVTSLTLLLQRHGYEVLHAETGAFHDPRYSDSMRILAAKSKPPRTTHRPFISDELRRRGIERIAVWGAGLQTFELLLPYIDAAIISCFIDSSPAKQGTAIVGKPVIAPERLVAQSRTAVLINSIDYEREIRERIEQDFRPYVTEVFSMADVLRNEHQRAFATMAADT